MLPPCPQSKSTLRSRLNSLSAKGGRKFLEESVGEVAVPVPGNRLHFTYHVQAVTRNAHDHTLDGSRHVDVPIEKSEPPTWQTSPGIRARRQCRNPAGFSSGKSLYPECPLHYRFAVVMNAQSRPAMLSLRNCRWLPTVDHDD
jgi:hypothetical protein